MAEDAPSPMAAAMFWRQQQERAKRRDSRPKPAAAASQPSGGPGGASAAMVRQIRRVNGVDERKPQPLSTENRSRLLGAIWDFEATSNEPENSPARRNAVARLRQFAEAHPDNELARNALEYDRIRRTHMLRDSSGQTKAERDATVGENARLNWLENRSADTLEGYAQRNPDGLLASVAGDRGWFGDAKERDRVARGRPTSGLSATEQAALEQPAPDWLMRAARGNPYGVDASPPPSRAPTVDPNTLEVRPSLTRYEDGRPVVDRDRAYMARRLFRPKP